MGEVMTTIYVSSWRGDGAGGFYWSFYESFARDWFESEKRSWSKSNEFVYLRLVKVEVPTEVGIDPDKITDWVESNLNDVEYPITKAELWEPLPALAVFCNLKQVTAD